MLAALAVKPKIKVIHDQRIAQENQPLDLLPLCLPLFKELCVMTAVHRLAV